MGKRISALCLGLLFVAASTVAAYAVTPDTTVSFADSLINVDPDTSGWSTDSSTADLGTSSWSILGGFGSVTAIGGNLSHRLTRGIGILGGEPDETDTLEQLVLAFTGPVWPVSFEIRSLFTGEGPLGEAEVGQVEFFRNDVSLGPAQTFTGVEGDGTNGVFFQTVDTSGWSSPIDKAVFSVPEGSRAYTEFALAKVTGTVVPEPISAALFLVGGGLLIARARRKKA